VGDGGAFNDVGEARLSFRVGESTLTLVLKGGKQSGVRRSKAFSKLPILMSREKAITLALSTGYKIQIEPSDPRNSMEHLPRSIIGDVLFPAARRA